MRRTFFPSRTGRPRSGGGEYILHHRDRERFGRILLPNGAGVNRNVANCREDLPVCWAISKKSTLATQKGQEQKPRTHKHTGLSLCGGSRPVQNRGRLCCFCDAKNQQRGICSWIYPAVGVVDVGFTESGSCPRQLTRLRRVRLSASPVRISAPASHTHR